MRKSVFARQRDRAAKHANDTVDILDSSKKKSSKESQPENPTRDRHHHDIKSRTEAVNKVMKALDRVNLIGICGFGGTGKMTMMHEVCERVIVQRLYDDVVMFTVSSNLDMFVLQRKLAEMLGLRQFDEASSVHERADLLCRKLNRVGRRSLIILDDIWSKLNLNEVGIPVGTACKVILTSRSQYVCMQMGSEMNIQVGMLPKEEAWNLFKWTAGDVAEHEHIRDIATDIAYLCGGLPIALVTIARTLAMSTDSRVWEDARERLTAAKTDIEKVTGGTPQFGSNFMIYSSIKLSFDFLATENPNALQLLLFCCQYPEEYVIKVEKLVRHYLVLDLLDDFEAKDARKRVIELIQFLKSCFLLMAVDVYEDLEDQTVTMHDFVRGLALSLIPEMDQEKRHKIHMNIMVGKRSSDSDSHELGTNEADYPKLKLLMQAPLDHELLNIRFLEQMQELRVFENAPDDMHHSLPSIHVLKDLRMLSLEGARLDEDVGSKIGMLHKLQFLSFFGSSIVSFPRQIGQLRNLKSLDLRCRQGAGPIPRGILPGLEYLEDLYMGNFYFWRKADNGEGGVDAESYGRVAELDSLSNLITFQIPHLDPMELLDLDHFPLDKLERFCFGPPGRPWLLQAQSADSLRPMSIGRTVQLERVGVEWGLEARMQLIVRSAVDLRLGDTDWTSLQMIEKFESLKELTLTSCNGLAYIIHDPMDSGEGSRRTVFMDLESLFLMRMDGVIEICHNGKLPAGYLGKLKELEIGYLPRLRRLCASQVDPLCLVNLNKVMICECPVLKTIFPHSIAKSLSKLRSLSVSSCGMLEAIVSKVEGRGRGIKKEPNYFTVVVHFPELRCVEIYNLPKLGGVYDLDVDDNRREQPLFTPLVILPSIERLKVEESHKLKQIVKCRVRGVQKYSTSTWLKNLQQVDVKSCNSLETVFDFEGVEDMGDDALSILGKLEEITLRTLPKLDHICWMLPKEIHAFQKLRRMEVEGCRSLVYLLSSSMAHILVNLESLSVENCKSMEEVIKLNEDCSEDKEIVFHSLKSVTLGHSEKLSSFCSSDQQDFEFPSLMEISIIQCPGMKTFCFGNLTAEQLCGVRFANSSSGGDETVWKNDLNETIRHLNPSVTQMKSGVKEDGSFHANPVDVGDIHVPHAFDQLFNLIKVCGLELLQQLDHSRHTGRSILLEQQQTSSKPKKASVLARKKASMKKVQLALAPKKASLDTIVASSSPTVPSSNASPVQPKTDKGLSYSSSSSPYDDRSSRILVQGVYVKAEMKPTFEEIVTANPNFLSKLRFKKPEMKTFFVESAICCLDNLRQCTACTISPGSLASIKDSLDDLETSGLDMHWLERGYKRASLVLEKQNVVSALVKLARLEKERAEAKEEFETANAKFEHLTVLRDASKAECDALMEEEEAAGNELFGGGVSIETSLGDGLLD